MMTLSFSEQVVIVADFYLEYADEYPDVVDIYDLGLPLAVAFVQGGVESLTQAGKDWITEAYEGICEALGVDKYGDYDSLDDMVELNEQG